MREVIWSIEDNEKFQVWSICDGIIIMNLVRLGDLGCMWEVINQLKYLRCFDYNNKRPYNKMEKYI